MTFDDFIVFVESLPPKTCAEEDELLYKLRQLRLHGPQIEYMVRVPQEDL